MSITLIATGFKRQEESESRSSQVPIVTSFVYFPLFLLRILMSHDTPCPGWRRKQPRSLGLVFSRFPGGWSCIADPRVPTEERAFRVSTSLNTLWFIVFFLSWFSPFMVVWYDAGLVSRSLIVSKVEQMFES